MVPGLLGQGMEQTSMDCELCELFPSLVLCCPGASALALRGSSALECPQEGPAEPLLSLSTTAQSSYSRERPGGCLPWLSPPPSVGNTLLSCFL